MADAESTETTLRDTIEQAYEATIPSEPAPAPSAVEPQVGAEPEPSAATPIERARDEKTGQFAKGETKPKAPAAAPTAATVVPAEAPRAHPKVPSSWKKDYHDHWGKLDPSVADYILQREGEYAKGVSTYKNEWENAKPLMDALGPYQASIQALGMKPAQFVSNLASAHETLSRGSPESRLSTFMKLAQDYQVPVQQMFVRGQDGQVYFNPQLQQQHQAQAAQRSETSQVNVKEQVRQEMAAVMGQQQIQQFSEAKDAQGNPAHPHFEAVKAKMALLLDAGEAQDLNDAYRKAIRLDDALWQTEQETKAKADEAARLESQRKAVAAAKAANVSTRTATPSSGADGSKSKGGSIRGALEDAYEQHVGAGRV